MAVKAEVKEWLKAHGVWTAFWKRRDEFKAGGDAPAEANRRALAEFYCPNDSPAVAQAQAGDSPAGGNGNATSEA